MYKVPEDWRGEILNRLRQLIKEADPEIVEEVKWKTASNPGGVLAWYKDGFLCTGETFKKHLRFSFAKGPALKDHDPTNLINSYRAIVIKEEDRIDEAAFKDLIRAAAELNRQHQENKKK